MKPRGLRTSQEADEFYEQSDLEFLELMEPVAEHAWNAYWNSVEMEEFDQRIVSNLLEWIEHHSWHLNSLNIAPVNAGRDMEIPPDDLSVEIARTPEAIELRLKAQIPLFWFLLVISNDNEVYIPDIFLNSSEQYEACSWSPEVLRSNPIEMPPSISGRLVCIASTEMFISPPSSDIELILSSLLQRLQESVHRKQFNIQLIQGTI